MNNKFFFKLSTFLSLQALLVFSLAFFIPPTPRARTTLLFAPIDKNILLRSSPNPRLILVGGSNLSFGINSLLIRDSLNVCPVNTGIHAGLGLSYMLNNTANYIKPGDLVVIIPEYVQFYGDFAYGREELLRVAIDVDRSVLKNLKFRQWLSIISKIPKMSLSKLNPREYLFDKPDPELDVYGKDSFNEYGDAVVHWKFKRKDFSPFNATGGEINSEIIKEIVEFRDFSKSRGAEVYVSFPGLQNISFENDKIQIDRIYQSLLNSKISILGNPERYKIPNEMMFDTPYHLNKNGVDFRTRLLVEDLINANIDFPLQPTEEMLKHCGGSEGGFLR